MRTDYTLPIVLGVGAVAIYMLVTHQSAKEAPAPQPQPFPIPPIPPLPPLPQPKPDVNTLLAQATAMIQAAAMNPSSVDPAQMEALATQLEANGRPNEALLLRQWAATVRISRGALPTGGAGFPAPPGPPPAIVPTAGCVPGMGQLPPGVNARVAYLLADPNADAAEVEQLAGLIAPCGFAGTVAQLTARAQLLKSMKGGTP